MVMGAPANPIYRFGPFRYDFGQRLLFRQNELVPLAPKVAETLHILIESHGKVVERAELMRRLWPDTTVEEIGLARNISQLRKGLGGDGGSVAYIETLPKRGYRFVAEIETEAPESQGEPPLVSRIQHSNRRYRRFALAAAALVAILALIYWQFYRPSRYLSSGEGVANIALVPFECLSPELNCYTFPRGLNDLLATHLSRLDSIHVLSPSTVRSYQHARLSMPFMARILRMDLMLDGTIQRAGDRVRVTARLVDVHSAKIIWSDSYEYPASDLPKAQSETAQVVAAAVASQLGTHPKVQIQNH